MKRIIVLLLAALVFSGCSFKVPESGKGKTNNSNTDSNAAEITLRDKDGKTVSIYDAPIYDRCGVKAVFSGNNGKAATLTVTNGSDKALRLRSSYMSADGVLRNDLTVSSDPIPAGETAGITLDGTGSGFSGISSLRTRFYLEDEDYRVLEDSLSDPLEVVLSDTLYLASKQLYTVVYEDERLLLGLCGVTYREDSNRVALNIYAENKTDSDFCLESLGAECVPKDYFTTLNVILPARSGGKFTMRASTRNSTLSPSELDSISLSLQLSGLEYYYGLKQEDPPKTEKFTIRLPKTGRPENVIPDTVVSTVDREQYIAELAASGELTPLTPVGQSNLMFENENILADLVYMGRENNGSISLHFRVQNKLQKQIKLDPVGTVNGATLAFSCYGGIKPMTEQYIEVTCSAADESIIGSFSDLAVRLEYSYDDGSYDNSSYIGATDPFYFQVSETLSRPGVPKGAKQIYSDDICDLYLLGTEKEEDRNAVDLKVYAVNKSEKVIIVSAYTDSDRIYILKNLGMFRGTYTVGTLKVTTFAEDIQLTEETVKDMKIAVSIYDIDGNVLSEGEAGL